LFKRISKDDSLSIVSDSSERLSWSELLARFEGIAPGTHFLEGGNSIEQAVVILAAASGLCSAVPLNPRWTAQERDAVRRQFDGEKIPPGVFIATSGSQGRPKLVHLSPDALVMHALLVNEHLDVGEEDVWLACLPFFHVGGMAIVLRCALARAGMVITSTQDAKTIAESLDKGVTLASFVPTTLRRVLSFRDHKLPKSIRTILLGGGPIPAELVQSYPQVLPTYGLTEAGSMVTCARVGCDESERATVGVPLAGMLVKIVDDSNHPLPRGQSGRIIVKSEGVATAYWKNENETARTFREGWIYTEDSGFVDARGYLHVLGRRDRVIVSGGENIALGEVEESIRSLTDVRDVICIGLDDSEWGQLIAVVIESDRDHPLDSLREALRGKLAAFKLPRKVVVVPELPLLANGKPDFSAAKKLFG